MKLGKEIPEGGLIPRGTTYITYYSDGKFSIQGDTGQSGPYANYEILDFEPPPKPPEPLKLVIGKWYLAHPPGSSNRVIRGYNGPNVPTSDLDGNRRDLPGAYEFIEEWGAL